MKILFLLQKSSNKKIGSGALPGKMLLVRNNKNNKINAYFMSG